MKIPAFTDNATPKVAGPRLKTAIPPISLNPTSNNNQKLTQKDHKKNAEDTNASSDLFIASISLETRY